MNADGQRPLRDCTANPARHPSFVALVERLDAAYTMSGDSGVRTLAMGAKMTMGHVPPNLPLRDLWQKLIELAAPAGRLSALIDAVLADPQVAAHHADIRRLANEAPAPAADTLWTGSPFPGLQAYDARWAQVFFGRDAEVAELLRRLTESGARFVAVMGASGSGKSSLMRAGLLPKLQARGWLVPTARPAERRDPLEALTMALGRAAPQLDLAAIDHAVNHGDPAAIRDLLLEAKPPDAEVLLFIDQFEEAFTQVGDEEGQRGQERDRDRFIAYLVKAAATPRLRVALAMRNDLLPSYQEAEGLPELLEGGIYFVKPPHPSAMEEIIRKPTAAAGLRIQEALVADLLRDAVHRPGALALLAFTLEELYRRGKDRGELHQADYRELGGLGGALAMRADEAFGQLTTELAARGVDAEAVFDRVFRQLARVDHDGAVTRRRVPREMLCPDPAGPEALLVDSFLGGKDKQGQDRPRLLVADEEGGEGPGSPADRPSTAMVEVIHERLFTDWLLLEGVIQNYRDDYHILRQVQQDAKAWDRKGRPPQLLWPHERQVDAELMRQRLGEVSLTELERDFLTPEWQRLVARLDDIDLPHRERLSIGDRLAVIGGQRGDPRPGVGLDVRGLPDVLAEGYWCWVEPGVVTLEGGHRSHRVAHPFKIGRFPVTWCQYQAFLDDQENGHRAERWWKGLQHRPPRTNPRHYVLNRPVVDVSWYDALAYCRWLSWKLWPDGSTSVNLPTEQEWQLAATGGDRDQEYPWPGNWDGRKANTSEAGLSQTTAVGVYPQGAAPCDALDMAGNVWEWCLNEDGNPDRVALGGGAARVVRGGSWYVVHGRARAAFRYGDYPSGWSPFVGFRLVVSSPISPGPLAAGAA